jgi:molybdate transport system substrate-binding protein
MRRTARAVATVLLLVSTGSVAACGGGSSASVNAASDSSGSSDSSEQTKLTVFTAASLTSTFTELGRTFEAAHKGVTVSFSFGGSSDLAAQIQQGAPADVFASADTKNMDKAVSAHAVEGTPVSFASNTLEIAVPPDDPAGVRSLRDLAKPATKVVLCAPEVPCGAAALKVEAAAKVRIKPVSEEQSVTDVLTKVESGEADAGLVYVTDVRAAGAKARGVTFPESSDAVNTYPIAALATSRHPALAKEFVDLVTGAEGRSVLAHAGFAKP